MGYPRLSIAFFHRDKEVDHWALYLDTENRDECDMWQATGQTFEFVPTHMKGVRPESIPNFKEKWVMKASLTPKEAAKVRQISQPHPVDNEGAYWDCRVFCFEIMAELERADVLNREDADYRSARRKLHKKWKTDDGLFHHDSEDQEDDEEELPDLTRANDSDLEDPEEEASAQGADVIYNQATSGRPSTAGEKSYVGRKRAFSSGSPDNAIAAVTSKPECETTKSKFDAKETKRQKDR